MLIFVMLSAIMQSVVTLSHYSEYLSAYFLDTILQYFPMTRDGSTVVVHLTVKREVKDSKPPSI
jgi:hypothetical protein